MRVTGRGLASRQKSLRDEQSSTYELTKIRQEASNVANTMRFVVPPTKALATKLD